MKRTALYRVGSFDPGTMYYLRGQSARIPQLGDVFIEQIDAVVEQELLFPLGMQRKISIVFGEIFRNVILNARPLGDNFGRGIMTNARSSRKKSNY